MISVQGKISARDPSEELHGSQICIKQSKKGNKPSSKISLKSLEADLNNNLQTFYSSSFKLWCIIHDREFNNSFHKNLVSIQ